LIKHAAAAERIWFQRFWAGLDESECDGYSRRDEGAFAVPDDESLAEVIAEFERASQRSRWTLLMFIGEFARHAGHGDILREQIDSDS
jgi:hypothetical protein